MPKAKGVSNRRTRRQTVPYERPADHEEPRERAAEQENVLEGLVSKFREWLQGQGGLGIPLPLQHNPTIATEATVSQPTTSESIATIASANVSVDPIPNLNSNKATLSPFNEVHKLAAADGMVSLPLSSGLSMKVIEKIWSGEFVEMSTLVSNKDVDGYDEKAFRICSLNDGTVKLAESDKPRWLSFDTWRRAFDKFSAVRAMKFPAEAAHLLKYANIVSELCARGGNHNFYDRQFRLLKQTSQIPWGELHVELWLMSINRRNPPAQRQGTMPSMSFQPSSGQGHASRRGQGGRAIPKGSCYSFHGGSGECSRGSQCIFSHRCPQCGGAHSLLQHNSASRGGFNGGRGGRATNSNASGSGYQQTQNPTYSNPQPSRQTQRGSTTWIRGGNISRGRN